MNDFAKSQLTKYGWMEGKGLGKYENGITQALKPNLKFDTAGIGHKDEDWNNWWENVFNKAANSIKVESKTHGVSIVASKECSSNDFLKQDLNEKSKHSINYGNFVKTSTLYNGNLIAEHNPNICKTQTVENITHFHLSDDELFRICGGRTTHKGARHGLTLNGKLKRIAQQETDLLNTNSYINTPQKLQNNRNLSPSDEYKKTNNKNEILLTSVTEVATARVSKTTRKKNRKCINDLSHQLNIWCNVNDNDDKNIHSIIKDELKQEQKKRSRKRKRKRKEKGKNMYSVKMEEINNTPSGILFFMKQKSVRGITKQNIQKQVSNDIEKEYMDIPVFKKQKKLKKKRDPDNHQDIINTWKELNGSQIKKFKKLRKGDRDLLDVIKDEQTNTLQLRAKCFCSEISVQSYKANDSSVCKAQPASKLSDSRFKINANFLNARIAKKKKAKLRKKQNLKLANITKSLQAVHFNSESENSSREK